LFIVPHLRLLGLRFRATACAHFISQTVIVIPAKAGTQRSSQDLGSGSSLRFGRNDENNFITRLSRPPGRKPLLDHAGLR
jgi:hypothetical protein